MSAELMSVQEANELAEHEAVIERGLKTFIDVGTRLAAVRDNRLYRGDYATFEAYCEGRWSFSDRRARQLIDAATTVAALPTGTIVPVSESQARELSGLNLEDAVEVMRIAHSGSNGKITAKGIAAARQMVTQRCYPYQEHTVIGFFPWDQTVVDAIADHLNRDRSQLLVDVENPGDPPQSISGFLRIAYPIALSADGTTIIDGRLRYAAYRKAGIKPCFKRIDAGADDDAIIDYILALNLYRQHLNEGQRAMVAVGVGYDEVGPSAVMTRYGVDSETAHDRQSSADGGDS